MDLAAHRAASGGRILFGPDWSLEAEEWWTEAELLAGGLIRRGLSSGDTLLVALELGRTWALVQLAGAWTGIVVATLPKADDPSKLTAWAKLLGAKYLLTDRRILKGWQVHGVLDVALQPFSGVFYEAHPLRGSLGLDGRVAAKLVSLEVLRAEGRTLLDASPSVLAERRRSVRPDSLAAAVLTAGGTSETRAAGLTHRGLLATCAGLAQRLRLGPRDVVATLTRPSHVLTLLSFWSGVQAGAAMYAGSEDPGRDVTVVFTGPERLLDVLRASAPDVRSVGGAANRLWRWAVQAAGQGKRGALASLSRSVAGGVLSRNIKRGLGASRLRTMVLVGASVPGLLRDVLEAAGFRPVGGYGAAETGGVTHLEHPGRPSEGGAGWPLDGVETRLAPSGEVLVRGETLAGRLFSSEGAHPLPTDEDGWYHTGDVALMEGDGSWAVLGRREDLVRVRGQLVSLAEAEVLFLSFPEVRRVSVVPTSRGLVALVEMDRDWLWSAVGGRGHRPTDWRPETDGRVDRLLRRMKTRVNRALGGGKTVIHECVPLWEGFSEARGEVDGSGRTRRSVVAQLRQELLSSPSGEGE